MEKFYYTYVLLSLKDNNFYTGYTNNIKRRFEEHCKGYVESTKDRKPLKLIYYEACLSQADATHREKYLKSFHGKMFLRNRLKSYLTGWRESREANFWYVVIDRLEIGDCKLCKELLQESDEIKLIFGSIASKRKD